MIRVLSLGFAERSLLKGFTGAVTDLAFAHLDSSLLGCVDEAGNLMVWQITCSGNKILYPRTESTHVALLKVYWCQEVASFAIFLNSASQRSNCGSHPKAWGHPTGLSPAPNLVPVHPGWQRGQSGGRQPDIGTFTWRQGTSACALYRVEKKKHLLILNLLWES